MATLITNYGGRPVEAPSMREIPLETNTEALAFADALIGQEIDIVVLLTGVGTRALLRVVEQVRGSTTAFVEALAATRIAARGPKPVAVLRELGITPWIVASEPNTWRELLAAFDGKRDDVPLSGLRIAIQEYGVSNTALLDGLTERGARVLSVPVYQWALPEDLGPLRVAIDALGRGDIDVVLFTAATQVTHLMQVAGEMGMADAVRSGLSRTLVASIGPTTSEELREKGLRVDLEPSHPKMGFLVREAAERVG
jgi:uroporphyrinogen-III synthase